MAVGYVLSGGALDARRRARAGAEGVILVSVAGLYPPPPDRAHRWRYHATTPMTAPGSARARDPGNAQDPGRLALLDELRRAAVAAYGEERAAEAPFLAALEWAATCGWRVMQEPLEPLDPPPAGPAAEAA